MTEHAISIKNHTNDARENQVFHDSADVEDFILMIKMQNNRVRYQLVQLKILSYI